MYPISYQQLILAGNATVGPITNSTVLTLGGSTNVGTIVWQKCINYTAAITNLVSGC